MREKAFFPLLLSFLLGLWASPAWAGSGVLTPVGPAKGIVDSLTLHPASPGKVWMGFSAGGIDRSDDRGASWVWAGRPMAGRGVAAVAADPSRPDALWAATRSGVFHTDDGGNHWRRITGDAYTAAIGGASPRSLAVVDGAIYVRSYQRLLVSRDGGSTWEILYEASGYNALDGFAGTPDGLFLPSSSIYGGELLRSRDGGLTWQSLPGYWREGIGQIEATPFGLYVNTVRDDLSVLLRSTDGGETWQRILAGAPGERLSVGPLAIDARSPLTLWALAATWPDETYDNRLYVSRDGGTTWRQRGPAPFGAPLAVEPGTGVLYVSYYEKLARSLDGGRTWRTLLHYPDPLSPPARVAFEPGNPASMALVVGNRLSLSRDGARTWWMPDPEAQLTDIDIDPADPDRMVGTSGAALVTSADGGRTWERGSAVFGYVDQLVRTRWRTLFATGCGIYRSTDDGYHWRNTLPCKARYAPTTRRLLRKLVADPADPERLYALTALVKDFNPDYDYDTLHEHPAILWQSRDGGLTWRKTAQGVKAVAVGPSGRVYIARGLDLLASDDGTSTWRLLSRLPREAHDLVAPPEEPDAFFALTRSAVYRSEDAGRSWSEVPTHLDPFLLDLGAFSALVPHPTDPRTVFVTSQGAVFHLRVP